MELILSLVFTNLRTVKQNFDITIHIELMISLSEISVERRPRSTVSVTKTSVGTPVGRGRSLWCTDHVFSGRRSTFGGDFSGLDF